MPVKIVLQEYVQEKAQEWAKEQNLDMRKSSSKMRIQERIELMKEVATNELCKPTAEEIENFAVRKPIKRPSYYDPIKKKYVHPESDSGIEAIRAYRKRYYDIPISLAIAIFVKYSGKKHFYIDSYDF